MSGKGFLLFLGGLFSIYASAQSNEAGLLIGGTITTGHEETLVNRGPASCPFPSLFCSQRRIEHAVGFSVESEVAHRVVNFRAASLYAELPLVIVASRDRRNFAKGVFPPTAFLESGPHSVFLTPSVK